MENLKRYRRKWEEGNSDWMVDAEHDSFLIKSYEDEIKSLDERIKYSKDMIKKISSPDDMWAKKEYKKLIADYEKRKKEIMKILKTWG